MEQRVLAASLVAALEWQPVVGFFVGAGMIALGIASSRGRVEELADRVAPPGGRAC